MKNDVFTWLRWLPVVTLMLIGTGVFAQARFGPRNDSAFNALRDRNGRMGLNLTDEQQEKITALRDAHQKEMTDIRNDLAIKRAELQKLQSAEAVNRNEVNKKLDEIGQLNTEMSKKAFALEQDILNLMTEEQKSVYRSRSGRILNGLPNRNFGLAPGWRRWQSRPFVAPDRRGWQAQPFMAPRMRNNPGRR